jgi:hypothetical protein
VEIECFCRTAYRKSFSWHRHKLIRLDFSRGK